MMHAPDAPSGHPRLRVREVIVETADARSIVMEVPAELKERFGYQPGQFLTFRIPSDLTGSVARSYSLSSAPGIDEHLKVTVKRTPGGYASHWLCDNIRAGDEVTVLPPSGVFTPGSVDDDLLLFAAGSGITPIISIIKSALRFGSGRVALLYANRSASSVIFAEELQHLVEQHAPRLHVQHWFDDANGFLESAHVQAFTELSPHAHAFMCGPGPFMDIVSQGLADAEFDRGRVNREIFASLSGDPFEAPPPAGRTTADSGEGSARTIVHLGGITHELPWPHGCTLVDTLLSRGIDVPYSCRSGECGSCAARVVSGEVVMANAEILDSQDIADGYILGCQSRPVSDAIEVQF